MEGRLGILPQTLAGCVTFEFVSMWLLTHTGGRVSLNREGKMGKNEGRLAARNSGAQLRAAGGQKRCAARMHIGHSEPTFVIMNDS